MLTRPSSPILLSFLVATVHLNPPYVMLYIYRVGQLQNFLISHYQGKRVSYITMLNTPTILLQRIPSNIILQSLLIIAKMHLSTTAFIAAFSMLAATGATTPEETIGVSLVPLSISAPHVLGLKIRPHLLFR